MPSWEVEVGEAGARLEAGELEKGFAALDSLAQRLPDNPEIAKERVAAYAAFGRLEEAVMELERLLARWPKEVAAHGAAVHVFAQQEDTDGVVRHCRELVRLGSDRVDALEMAARVLGKFGQVEEGATTADKLIALVNGQHPVGHMTKFVLFEENGRLEEATSAIEDGLREFPHFPAFLRIYAMVSNYRDDLDQAAIYAREFAAGQAIDSEYRPLDQWPNNRNPGRKLRVGYVSSDFRNHAVANFILGALRAHDPGEVEITCYLVWNKADAGTRRFESAPVKFRNCVGWGLKQIFAQVRTDKIDVLVDLNGQTSGGVPELFALRPAPVQFTYLGYPGSTGSHRVQGRIIDSVTDPLGTAWHASEERFALEGGMLSYEPVDSLTPLVERSPIEALKFGYTGNLLKISPTCIRAWKSVLDVVPESKLVIAKAQFENEENRSRVRQQFADCAFELDRLELVYTGRSREEFLSGYGLFDVSIDSMPYSGTTTVCESLAMGVPVITVLGSSHRERVAASILVHMGRPEWVASTLAELGTIAKKLVMDRHQLADLRWTLRQEFFDSPVCDADRLAGELERVYREAWQAWCAS